MESEGRQMKQCWIKYCTLKKPKNTLLKTDGCKCFYKASEPLLLPAGQADFTLINVGARGGGGEGGEGGYGLEYEGSLFLTSGSVSCAVPPSPPSPPPPDPHILITTYYSSRYTRTTCAFKGSVQQLFEGSFSHILFDTAVRHKQFLHAYVP